MKHFRLFLSRFILLAALCLAGKAPPLHADTPMERGWEHLEEAFKNLNEGLKDPNPSDKEKFKKQAGIIKEASIKIRDLDPKMVKTLPKGEQEAFLKAFRTEMDDFNTKIDALVVALEASDWARARGLMSELGKRKIPAHKQFRTKGYKKG
ncbi:MAG: hypothetical protein IT576_01185 [Verrucomicrobiales bacterium]|nr:hypothetical protein [Verrucomicrobiales bacterium]